jgi:hypothetical protein
MSAQGCFRVMGEEIRRSSLYQWFVHQSCLEHIIHLMHKLVLSYVKAYWSNLAKITNIWRTPGTVLKLKKGWVPMGKHILLLSIWSSCHD